MNRADTLCGMDGEMMTACRRHSEDYLTAFPPAGYLLPPFLQSVDSSVLKEIGKDRRLIMHAAGESGKGSDSISRVCPVLGPPGTA